MGKSLFTIIFLILALVVADQVKTFVKNNRSEPVKPVQVLSPIDEATSTDPYENYINGSSTEYIEELDNIDQELLDVAI